MGEDISPAIALATAWAAGEVETWTVLAQEAVVNDPLAAIRQLSYIVTQLAEMLAEKAGGHWTVGTVLQHLALDREEGSGDNGT